MRKLLVTLVVLCCAGYACAADKPAPVPPPAPAQAPVPATTSISGKVLEVKDVEIYTYLRLQTKAGEVWAAVSKAPVKVGSDVTIVNATVMHDFESKTLKKTFPQIYFGTIGGPVAGPAAGGPGPAAAGGDIGAMHAGVGKSVDVGDVKVAKASGPDARTVAEIVTKRVDLKDKTVTVRGKVVKFTPEVMGKNWIHLRDGSGSAADGTNDVLVTTKAEAKVGDVVLVKGVVHIDRDLGSGYSYKVLVEEATLQK